MPRFSRRSFLHLSAAASAAAAFRVMNEPMLAAAARRPPHAGRNHDRLQRESARPRPSSARRHGRPSSRKAGATLDNLTEELVKTFAQMEGLNPDHIQATVGSTPPLSLSVLAFTSPQKSYVTADPGIRTRHDDGVRT